MSLGVRVRSARKARNIPIAVLAEKADVCYSYISRIENGSRIPTQRVLLRIADALNVQPSYLLDGNEEVFPSFYNHLPKHLREFVINQENQSWLEAAYQAKEAGLKPQILTSIVQNMPD